MATLHIKLLMLARLPFMESSVQGCHPSKPKFSILHPPTLQSSQAARVHDVENASTVRVYSWLWSNSR